MGVFAIELHVSIGNQRIMIKGIMIKNIELRKVIVKRHSKLE